MELLNKEQQKVKDLLITKHNNEIVTATEELYEWIGDDTKPVLEDILFHWLQTYDSDIEQRNDAIFKFRRIFDFTETLSKIENSTPAGWEKSTDKHGFQRGDLKEKLN